jgi:hypothetical protein
VVSDTLETQNKLNVERQEDAPPPVAAPVPQQTNASEHSSESNNTKKRRTFGNKLFDWLVYPSIAWLGNSALGVYITHETGKGNEFAAFKWIRQANDKFYEKFNQSVESGIMKNVIKDKSPENIKAWAGGISTYFLLSLGGTLLMWPIKAMEDNRKKLAAKLDNTFGTTPPDQKEIEKEPKQSWFSVLSGRVLSVSIGFAAFLAMTPKNADKASKWFGEKVTSGLSKVFKNADKKNMREWMDIAAFDIVFTSITAAVTYMFSRFVAKKTQNDLDSTESMMTIDPATPTPFAPQEFDTVSKNTSQDKAFLKSAGIRPEDAEDIARLSNGSETAKKPFSENVVQRSSKPVQKSFTEMAERQSDQQVTVGA